MAREAPKRQLEELLKCSLCLGSYTNPRILQCSHIYCQDCIANVITDRGQAGRRSFPCPLCRRDTPVPVGGASGLQSVDCLINNLKDIQHSLGPVKKVSHCSVHGDKELELYCDSCDELICFKCAYKGARHYKHGYYAVGWELEHLGIRLSELALEDGATQGYARKVMCDFNAEVHSLQDDVTSALELTCKDRVLQMRRVLVTARDTMCTLPEKLRQQFDSPCPKFSSAQGDGLKQATVNELCTIRLTIMNIRHDLCKESSIISKECVLVSNSTRAKTIGEIKKIEQGRYRVSYYPTTTGRHNLHLKLNGKHIRGSPFSVLVKPQDTKLKGACGIAFGLEDEAVVVCEEDGHCVSILNSSGKRVLSFGYGHGKKQLNAPCGLAVDWMGNILVADSGNHRIQRFTARGKPLQSVGSKGNRQLEFNSPCDIAINPGSHIVYIVERGNHRVQLLNSDLTYAGKFGKHGFEHGNFNNPCGIACTGSGTVLVVDRGWRIAPIQEFTAKGKFLRAFNTCPTIMNTSRVSIATDSRNLVYLTANADIFVFTAEGRHIENLSIPDHYGATIRGIAVQGTVLLLCYFDHIKGCIHHTAGPAPPPSDSPTTAPSHLPSPPTVLSKCSFTNMCCYVGITLIILLSLAGLTARPS